MILIDTDVKVEKITVVPIPGGHWNAVFELTDVKSPETRLILSFYKKQVGYIMQQFYKADRKKMKAELRTEFLKREQVAIKGLRSEIDDLRMENSILVDQLELERKEEDAKASD